MTTQEIVSKLWNLCNVLRDDGIHLSPVCDRADLYPVSENGEGDRRGGADTRSIPLGQADCKKRH